MTTAYLDVDYTVADVVTAYLQSTLATEMQATCPVVTFYDPMSIDDAHRVIVSCPAFTGDEDRTGNGELDLEVAVKSLWTQADVSAETGEHRERVRAVRAAFFTDTIKADLNTAAAGKFLVNHVFMQADFSNKTTTQFLYSEMKLKLHISTQEA